MSGNYKKMEKFSVANVPPRFDLSQLPNAGEEGDSHLFCHGKTAKLYSRIVGFQDEKQVSTSRKRKIETKQQTLPE